MDHAIVPDKEVHGGQTVFTPSGRGIAIGKVDPAAGFQQHPDSLRGRSILAGVVGGFAGNHGVTGTQSVNQGLCQGFGIAVVGITLREAKVSSSRREPGFRCLELQTS